LKSFQLSAFSYQLVWQIVILSEAKDLLLAGSDEFAGHQP
jgi:hypothetical protein